MVKSLFFCVFLIKRKAQCKLHFGQDASTWANIFLDKRCMTYRCNYLITISLSHSTFRSYIFFKALCVEDLHASPSTIEAVGNLWWPMAHFSPLSYSYLEHVIWIKVQSPLPIGFFHWKTLVRFIHWSCGLKLLVLLSLEKSILLYHSFTVCL